ncbi:MAG: nuclear transport factor 2 family protein [Pseudomonas sp.]
MTIWSILQTYETTLNSNDIDTILSRYDSEPVFMPRHVPAPIGRDAVRAGYEQVFATIKRAIRFDLHEVEEADDWARTSSAGRTRILAAGQGRAGLRVIRRLLQAWSPAVCRNR